MVYTIYHLVCTKTSTITVPRQDMDSTTTTTTTTTTTNSTSSRRKRKKFPDPVSTDKSKRQKLVKTVDDNSIDQTYLRSKRAAWKKVEHFIVKEYPNICDDNNKVKLDKLTVDIFKDFVGGLSRPSLLDGHPVLQSYSSVNRYKLGMVNYMEEQKFEPTSRFDKELKKFMNSVARTQGKQRDSGDIEMYEGSDAIPLLFHHFLCMFLLRRGRKKDIWCLCIMLFAFTLICRINRVFSFRLNHFNFLGDSFSVKYGQAKTDKKGLNQWPKHMFSNPFEPKFDILFVFGLYISVFGIEEDGRVFNGLDGTSKDDIEDEEEALKKKKGYIQKKYRQLFEIST